MSNSLISHGLQHARLLCPSLSPGVCSESCPLIGDTIQPSHPLLPAFPPTFNLCQHQGLYQWVSSSHQVAKVLEFQLQHQSFQWILNFDFLFRLTGLTSWHSQGSLLQHHRVFLRDHNPTPKNPPSHMVSGVQVQGTRGPRILPSLRVDLPLLPYGSGLTPVGWGSLLPHRPQECL